MRIDTLAFAFAVSLLAALPGRADASPEHDALLYLDSQVMPKKAAACSARIANYPARFEPAFRTWLARNRQQLNSGEAFLRADAERTRVPYEPDMQAVATDVSRQWANAPLPTLQDNCESMLLQLRESEGS